MILLSIVAFGSLLTFIAWQFKKRRRSLSLAKMGTTPRMVPFSLPFGFDQLWEAISVRSPYVLILKISIITAMLVWTSSTRILKGRDQTHFS